MWRIISEKNSNVRFVLLRKTLMTYIRSSAECCANSLLTFSSISCSYLQGHHAKGFWDICDPWSFNLFRPSFFTAPARREKQMKETCSCQPGSYPSVFIPFSPSVSPSHLSWKQMRKSIFHMLENQSLIDFTKGCTIWPQNLRVELRYDEHIASHITALLDFRAKYTKDI